MRFIDVANDYITFNVYNQETIRAIRTVSVLFDRRACVCDVFELTLLDIQRFKSETLKVANAFTFNGYLAYIKLVARWGQQRGYMDASNILMMKRAPEPKPIPKVIDEESYFELIQFLLSNPGTVPCTWFWVIAIRFIYGVGLRRRQLVELEYRDIDWIESTLTLRHEGSKTGREWDVPLMDSVLSDLQQLKTATRTALGRKVSDDDKIFNICYFNPACTPDPKDKMKMRARYITDILKKVSAASGIKVGAHRLRHSMATALCNPKDPDVSPDIFFVQHLLGHTDISTTRNYVKTSIKNRRGYMEQNLVPSTLHEIDLGKIRKK